MPDYGEISQRTAMYAANEILNHVFATPPRRPIWWRRQWLWVKAWWLGRPELTWEARIAAWREEHPFGLKKVGAAPVRFRRPPPFNTKETDPMTNEAMRTYEGTKRLKATPLNKLGYCAMRGWDVPANEDPREPGYLVEYLDGGPAQPEMQALGHTGYVSWSPASVFNATYRLCETHIDRMRIEHEQLSSRIDKLDAFVGGDIFNAMTAMDQELLRIQLSAMRTYQRTLGTRLEAAERNTPRDEPFVRDEPVIDTSAFETGKTGDEVGTYTGPIDG